MGPGGVEFVVRRPRLEPLLALMGASTGLTAPIVAGNRWPIAPVAYDAAALGAVGGVIFAVALRASERHAERTPHQPLAGRPWLPPVGLWVGAAFIITIVLSLAEGWRPDEGALWLGGLAGALAGAATFPFGWWLLRRSSRAVRARRGSLVAGADVRSLWSVASVTLVAECALALPGWDGLSRYYRGWPPSDVGQWIMTSACVAALAIALLDLHAFSRAKNLDHRTDGLESLDPLADPAVAAPGGIDLGLGEDVYGRVHTDAHYRGTTRRIPAIVGDPRRSVRALSAALRRSAIIAVLLVGLAGVTLAMH